MPARLDHVLGSSPVCEAEDDLLAFLGRLDFVDVDDVVGAPALGQFQTILRGSHHDDGAGTALAGHDGGVEPDGTAALDDKVLHEPHFAETVVASDDAPKGAADANGLFFRQFVRHSDDVGLGRDVLVFGKTTSERTGRRPAVSGSLGAEHGLPLDLAPVALATVGVGPHDAIADLDRLAGGIDDPALAQLDDPSDGLMPLDVGQGALDGQFALLLMHVGAADAGHLHLDQNGPALHLGYGDLLDLERLPIFHQHRSLAGLGDITHHLPPFSSALMRSRQLQAHSRSGLKRAQARRISLSSCAPSPAWP